MTLTKADLVQQIYNKHDNLTKAQATESVESFLRLSKDALISGSDLLLSGFGKFNVRDKKPARDAILRPVRKLKFLHVEF